MNEIGDGFRVRSLAQTWRAGGRIARHDHAWGQLVYVTKGVVRVVTADRVWLAPPTRAIWLPPRLAHEIVIKGVVALRTLYIDPALARPLPAAEGALAVAPLLRELILHILAIGMLDPSRPDHDRLANVLIDLILEARPEDLSLVLPRDRRALALAERLRDAPGEHVDLAVAAGEVGASLRTLQRLFPRETGLTVEAWRQKARLIHGVACLSSGASVTTAALECGYASVGAFITAFRRQFGVTPGRYVAG